MTGRDLSNSSDHAGELNTDWSILPETHICPQKTLSDQQLHVCAVTVETIPYQSEGQRVRAEPPIRTLAED